MKEILLVVLLIFITQGVYAMTDKEQELYDALELASKYLGTSSNAGFRTLEYTPPAQALRNQADAMEQQDKDVAHIRQILDKYTER